MSLRIEELEPDALWRYYQRGYHCLMRSGLYFRQLLRPALSHVYFQRALPLLQQYARANHEGNDLPPGFREQLETCLLTARDLLHLDYAICLGYAELLGSSPGQLAEQPVMEWPGPAGYNGVFIAADAIMVAEMEAFTDEYESGEEEVPEDEGNEENGSEPPFDL